MKVRKLSPTSNREADYGPWSDVSAQSSALVLTVTFAVGAALPLPFVPINPLSIVIPVVAGSSLVSLALMGGLVVRTGGARIFVGAGREAFWGALSETQVFLEWNRFVEWRSHRPLSVWHLSGRE